MLWGKMGNFASDNIWGHVVPEFITYQTKLKMTKNNKKIELLEEGEARSAMVSFLSLIKDHHGLTRFIQDNGVNGKYLLVSKPYDLPFSKLTKILEIIQRFCATEEEYQEILHALSPIMTTFTNK